MILNKLFKTSLILQRQQLCILHYITGDPPGLVGLEMIGDPKG
jgi:hypothetical protein